MNPQTARPARSSQRGGGCAAWPPARKLRAVAVAGLLLGSAGIVACGTSAASSGPPLAAPGMVTTAILVFLFCWNEFLLAISLTSTIASRTAPASIAYFSGSSQFTVPTVPIAAAAVVITIRIVIFVVFFQRRIVAGLTSGAVKG